MLHAYIDQANYRSSTRTVCIPSLLSTVAQAHEDAKHLDKMRILMDGGFGFWAPASANCSKDQHINTTLKNIKDHFLPVSLGGSGL